MSDRCPYCSFQPESLNDFCDIHRPKTKENQMLKAKPKRSDFKPDRYGDNELIEAERDYYKQLAEFAISTLEEIEQNGRYTTIDYCPKTAAVEALSAIKQSEQDHELG